MVTNPTVAEDIKSPVPRWYLYL